MDEGGEGRGQRGDILHHLFVLLLLPTTYRQGYSLAAIMNWYLLLVISDLYPSRRLTYMSSIQSRVEKSKTRRGGIIFF